MNLNISEKEFHAIYTDIFSLNGSMFNFLKKNKRESSSGYAFKYGKSNDKISYEKISRIIFTF